MHHPDTDSLYPVSYTHLLTVGDVMNAIDCLAQICGEELRDGHEVHIEGLGYFCLLYTSFNRNSRTITQPIKMKCAAPAVQ